MTTITLLGHSAVRIEADGRTLLVDPGVFSDLSSLATADAILFTHGHADHLAAGALTDLAVEIWLPQDAVASLEEAGVASGRLHAVGPGDKFTVAGFDVTVLGDGQHAEIYPGLPGGDNNAYLIDGTILHTGDSLTPAPDPSMVRTLLLPVAAPWLRLADAIDLARSHANATVLPIHDAILSDGGKQLVDNILGVVLGADVYRRPAPGESVTR